MAFVTTPFAFPFCQVPSRSDLPVGTMSSPDLTGETPYFFEASLDEMFEYYWRAKTWGWSINIACTSVLDDLAHPGETITGTLSVTTSGTWAAYASVAQGEEDKLVCGVTAEIGGVYPETFTNACHLSYSFDPSLDHDDDVDVYLLAYLPFWSGFGEIVRWKYSDADDSIYFPLCLGSSLVVSGYTGASGAIGFQGYSWTDNIASSQPGYVNTSSLLLDDKAMPLHNFELANQVSTSPIVSGYVKPVAWYEYDPGDGGGPVWNSASGARLRDPFSII